MADQYNRDAVERLLAHSEWSAGIVFLPEGREDDGSGVYDEALINLVQDLRDDGVTASWADGPGQRSFRSQRSAADILWGAIAGFPVNIMAAVAYAKLAHWFERGPRSTGRVRLEIIQETSRPDGTITRAWRSLEGTGAEVAELMKATPPPEIPSGSSDD
ncbi:MAG: hypothetical protein ACRDTK_02090 [Mycobacterium sp.]